MHTNTKQLSKQVASIAEKILHSQDASDAEKMLAVSALSPSNNSDTDTVIELEGLASTVLRSPRYSDETKILAGSILVQFNRAY